MTLSRALAITPLLALFACTGAPDSGETAAASECGDLDGPGGDTGDIPNVLGGWTSTFAAGFYDDDCTAENLNAESEGWIGAFQMDGRAPDALYLEFNNADERYWGTMDPGGGVTFTGQHVHAEGILYAQFGGLVYHDQYQNRDMIDGAAFLGLDTDADGLIDCRAQGSWKAFKSGL